MKLFNFRLYAVRKIRDTFQTNKTINDFELIDREIATAKQSLEMLRRQVSAKIYILRFDDEIISFKFMLNQASY